MRRSQTSTPRKPRVVNPHAAGIDLGAREHYVCAGADRPVRTFGCYTEDLHSMAEWLLECGITTVAMEATGVFWISVHQVLERAGLDVVLVNAKHFKSVPGRKSDVQDCQWLQYLHEIGLLAGSFRPADDIVVMRTYLRQRANLTREAAQHIQRMQKALEQMNVHLHKVVSDMMGLTGRAILGAILAGERDPHRLAALRHHGVARSEPEFVAALTGDWREEHLFCLQQAWTIYHQLHGHIEQCDARIAACYAELARIEEPAELPPAKSAKHDNALRVALYRMTGVDLTAIHGMSPQTVLTLIGEVGVDMTKWPSDDHFASWLRLCPNNRITGGRSHGGRPLPTRNRAAEVFRKCAENLARSHCFFGDFYRRMRSRKGGPFAVVATAGKLARVFYRCLRDRVPYRDLGAQHFETAHRERAIRNALARLKRLGYEVPSPDVNASPQPVVR